MKANEYQKKASRTLIDAPGIKFTGKELMAIWNALGLAGESGEVAELIKKGIFHQQGINMEMLRKELGDVMWYLAALCTTLDIKLSDVLEENIHKLQIRYPKGYNATDSKRRVDLEKNRSKMK